MGNSCSDVCDAVTNSLLELGFPIDTDDECHDDIIAALNQCHLVRDEAVVMRWPNPE